ncbi:MAG: DNA repair protein RadC [Acidobacteria bacterium]|nr:DNA repair protein RadC [Acidobacteriota bacterium]
MDARDALHRLLERGPRSLADAELLAVILGNRSEMPEAVAESLLAGPDAWSELVLAGENLLERDGLNAAEAAMVMATLELGRRLAERRIPKRRPLSQPKALVTYLDLRYGYRDQEVLGALYLDARHRLLSEMEIFRGTLNRMSVEPGPILRKGLLQGAASVVIFHTHPSGNPTASAADVAFTRRLAQSADIVGLRLLDHLILGRGGRWMSLLKRSWVDGYQRKRRPRVETSRRVKPKYRHPETGETWAGCGSMARWLRLELEAGRSLEEFLVGDEGKEAVARALPG